MTLPPQSNFERFSNTKHFGCFDGLRALAVLWVLLFHGPRTGVEWVDRWLGGGDFGVDLFFVLSGFLITTLILRESPKPLGPRLRAFYVRRALRIFPLYYLAIGLYWGATRTFGRDSALELYQEYVPSLLLYYTDFKLAFASTGFPPFGHAWSLAVEEKYYLFWPFLVMVLPERRCLQVSLGLIILAIAWRFVLGQTYPGDLTARMYYSFETRVDSILWGSLFAFLMRKREVFEFIENKLGGALLVGAVLLLNAFAMYGENGSQWRYVVVPLLVLVPLGTYLIYPNMLGCRLLNSKPLVYVGRISYGIYVLHPLGDAVARKLIHGDGAPRACAVLGLSIVFSVLMADLSFRFFEAHFLRLKQRFR